jgi:hypothetical protein
MAGGRAQSGAGRARFLLGALLAIAGCAHAPSPEQAAQLRHQLRDAMNAQVSTREQRDEQSRLLVDVVDKGALSGLDRDQIRAAFGPGEACRIDLCSQHGFRESDWYYEIGHAEGDQIKQLPVLIVGFDPHERAARVWTLKTH